MRAYIVASAVVAASVLAAACGGTGDSRREYTLKGQILSIADDRMEANIKHEDIPNFMPAMTMPYRVKDSKAFEGVKPGDLISSRLIIVSNEAFLEDVKKVGEAPLEEKPGADAAPPPASSGFELLAPGEPLPDAAFVDQDGQRRSLASYKGSTVVLTFIYTTCPLPTFCPLMDQHFASLQRALPADSRVQLLSVSFDPATDTPAVLKKHASKVGADPKRWTILTGNRGLAEANYSQIGTLSHEFFHAWLVERLRPAELEPFDFTRANPTPSLWFAEGFTSYYGPLTIARAGVWSVDEYLADLSRALNYTLNRPGRSYHGPMEMSLRAPFVDAATAIDPRQDHIFTSYYLYGAVIAAGLDLALRQREATLDTYMQTLWRSHGVTERPFVTADLKAALATVTDQRFADTFFATQIEGSQLPDFAPLLAQAGLVLRPANPGRGWVGPTPVRGDASGVTVAGYPTPGTPLYDAGVGAGARVTTLGGQPIASEGDWTTALAARKPGERVEIAFTHLGQERRATMTLAADPTLEVVRIEANGGKLTPAQAKFRAGWLGTQP